MNDNLANFGKGYLFGTIIFSRPVRFLFRWICWLIAVPAGVGNLMDGKVHGRLHRARHRRVLDVAALAVVPSRRLRLRRMTIRSLTFGLAARRLGGAASSAGNS